MKKVILTTDSNNVSVVVSPVGFLHEQLRDKMLAGIVQFSFTKKDGSVRAAYGTIHPDKIGDVQPAAKDIVVNPNATTGTYFDLDANAWRSYTIANLIAIY